MPLHIYIASLPSNCCLFLQVTRTVIVERRTSGASVIQTYTSSRNRISGILSQNIPKRSGRWSRRAASCCGRTTSWTRRWPDGRTWSRTVSRKRSKAWNPPTISWTLASPVYWQSLTPCRSNWPKDWPRSNRSYIKRIFRLSWGLVLHLHCLLCGPLVRGRNRRTAMPSLASARETFGCTWKPLCDETYSDIASNNIGMCCLSIEHRFSTCGPRTPGGVPGGPWTRPKIFQILKKKIWKQENLENFCNLYPVNH